MTYVITFILGGMFGAMLMAMMVAGGTPDDDELESRHWKDVDELMKEDERKS